MRRGKLLLLAALLVSIGVSQAPSLDVGLFGDDYAHRRFMLDHLAGVPTSTPWWNMFDARVAAPGPGIGPDHRPDPSTLFGRLPWWVGEEFSFALLRPLSTASHFIDYMLWPERPWAMHAHNLVLFAAVVALAAALYESVLGDGWQVLVAATMFALDDANAAATVWIASRNTLLTAIFVLATLWAYDRGARGDRRSLLVAPLSLLLAHASSEGAVAAWAYLVAYACWLDPRAARARVRSLLPLAVVSVAWIGLSSALGYGVRGSSIYVDPRFDPGLFAQEVVRRFPMLLETLLALPPFYTMTLGDSAVLAAYASRAYVVVLLAAALWAAVRSRQVAFFGLATLLSLVPLCATDGFTRLLLLSSFAAHGLATALLVVVVRAAAGSRAWLVAPLGCALLFIHGWVALELPRTGVRFAKMVNGSVEHAAQTLPSGAALQGATIMVLSYPDYLRSVFIALYRRELFAPGPERMHFLGLSNAPVQVTRTEPGAIVLEPVGGYLLDLTSLYVRRTDQRFTPGQRFELGEARLEVAAVSDDGRPSSVIVRPATQRALLWVSWNESLQRFDRISLPDVGHSIWIGPPR